MTPEAAWQMMEFHLDEQACEVAREYRHIIEAAIRAESAGGLAEALTAEMLGVESSLTQASERLERAIHLAARLAEAER